jgi:serine/threonine protein kinase
MPNETSRFESLQLVGQGSFGRVFCATDSILNRKVAIKSYSIDVDRLGEVIQSLASWSKLSHPNIAQVTDIARGDKTLEVVMTFCDGGELTDKLSQISKHSVTAGKIFLSICDAVKTMHKQGLIHRDIKLSNVMLDSSDQPILIDLDRCMRIDDNSSSDVVGTIGYLAPELSKPGASSTVASDTFSLGVLLFELLTGSPIEKMTQQDRITISQAKKSLTVPSGTSNARDWNAILSKATHAEANKRYESIEALADDVSRAINSRPISARQVRYTEALVRWLRRNPILAGVSSGVALMLVLCLIVTAVSRQSAIASQSLVEKNTQNLNDRVVESKRSQDELSKLVELNSTELRAAEAAESEQATATQGAKDAQANLESELSRAQQLTEELQNLLNQAKESKNKLDLATIDEAKSVDILQDAEFAKRATTYRINFTAAWNFVQEGKWQEAETLANELDKELASVEFQILKDSIQNKLASPVKIELGSSVANLDSMNAELARRYLLNKEKRILRVSPYKRGNSLIIRDSTDIELLTITSISQSGLSILKDGTLISHESDGYAAWSFSPKSWIPSKSKVMAIEVENRIRDERANVSPDWLWESNPENFVNGGSLASNVKDAKRLAMINSLRKSNLYRERFREFSSYQWQSEPATEARHYGDINVNANEVGLPTNSIASPYIHSFAISPSGALLFFDGGRLWIYDPKNRAYIATQISVTKDSNPSLAVDKQNNLFYTSSNLNGTTDLTTIKLMELLQSTPNPIRVRSFPGTLSISAPFGWDTQHLYVADGKQISRVTLPITEDSLLEPWLSLKLNGLEIARFLPLNQDQVVCTLIDPARKKRSHIHMDRREQGYRFVGELGACAVGGDGQAKTINEFGALVPLEFTTDDTSARSPEAQSQASITDAISAAEWIVSRGGKVQVTARNEWISDLAGCKSIQPSESITRIVLTKEDNTIAPRRMDGFGLLRQFDNITDMHFRGVRVDPVMIDVLEGMPFLRTLNLFGTNLTDEYLEPISKMKDLTLLDLGANGALTDAGIKKIAGLKKLEFLNIFESQATDEMIDTVLLQLPNLKRVQFQLSKITLDGRDRFKAKAPYCKIEYFDVGFRNPPATPPAPAPNAVSNANFKFQKLSKTTGLKDYVVEKGGGAQADVDEQENETRINVRSVGENTWQPQLVSKPIELIDGQNYQITLVASSSNNSKTKILASRAGGNYSPIGLVREIQLSNKSATYKFEFKANIAEKISSRISMHLGFSVGEIRVERFDIKPIAWQID